MYPLIVLAVALSGARLFMNRKPFQTVTRHQNPVNSDGLSGRANLGGDTSWGEGTHNKY